MVPANLTARKGLGMFLFVVAAFTINAWATQTQIRAQDAQTARVVVNAERSVANANRIDANAVALTKVIAAECENRNDAASGVNEVLDVLIAGAKASTVYSETERVERLVRYRTAKIPMVLCGP